MTNLIISAVCNRNCVYCFTNDAGRADARRFLDLDDLATRLDFLDRSGVEHARLLGGEPTLHPRFPELVALARERDKKITVFTNGLTPPAALDCLAALSPDVCHVLVNANAPADMSPADFARLRATLRRLGQRASLGFNIYRMDCSFDFLRELITETGCKPSIRLGMAMPCLSGDNRHIHPKQYRFIAQRIVRFAQEAARAGARLEFDCGFVRCMFSDDDLAVLEACNADVGWRCNAILDIDIEGNILHCYPLSSMFSLSFTSYPDAAAFRSAFESLTQPYRQTGIYQECFSCPFKTSGECPGGCLSVTIRRFRHTPFTLPAPK